MPSLRATFARAYGPALVTGGQWTAMRMHLAKPTCSPLCARCLVCPDTVEHRLWTCEDNSDLLERLSARIFGRGHSAFLDHRMLPPCLARCDIIPSGYTYLGLSSPPQMIVDYLLEAAGRASLAFHTSAVD